MAPRERSGEADGVEVELPGNPTAARRARDVVRQTLTRWHLPQLVDACVLVVSELVTNAIRHGRPPLAIALRRVGGKVALDVRDAGNAFQSEERRQATTDSESGRGLDIVRALTDETAVEDVAGNGKTVRATWRVDGP